MGSEQSRGLSGSEADHYASSTNFTRDEIKALWYHFKTINSQHDTITRDEFQAAILFKDSALLDRIFQVFDIDKDDTISFTEYCSCLSAISSKASKDDKITFSFQIYDFDGDGLISIGDLTAVVVATLREHNIVISRADIDYVVQTTMEEAAPKIPGMISLDEYKLMVVNRPHMLDQLTINISNIIAEYKANNLINLTTPRDLPKTPRGYKG
eukprot:gene10153-13656_t